MESKCKGKRRGSWSLYIAAFPFSECSILRLTIIVFPFRSHLKLLESPKPNRNGSVKSGFPLKVFNQPESPLKNRNRFLIKFKCLLIDYFVNFLITLMPSKFLCLAKKKLKI